jgi:hypothetical protein
MPQRWVRPRGVVLVVRVGAVGWVLGVGVVVCGEVEACGVCMVVASCYWR